MVQRKIVGAFVVGVLAVGIAACRDGADSTGAAAAPTDAGGREAAAPSAKAGGEGDGAIRGTVVFTGAAPERKPVDMSADPVCARHEVLSQDVLVQDGHLANVVAWISNQDLPKKAEKAPVVVDQAGCTYQPRVQCAEAGQPVKFENSDPTLHNVHAYLGADDGKTLFNKAQMPGTPPFEETFTEGGRFLHFTCDVHPWMNGWIFVSENGYCAVSGEDGSFDIGGLPPGHYRVTTWHEVYGRKSWDVTVAAGRPAELKVTYGPADKGG